MPKINLLYLITKLELGGAQKQLLSLISGLDRQKFNIFLFTAKQGLLLDQALSISGVSVNRSRFLERRINPFNDLLALIDIYRFIKKNHIEIVHTHSSKSGILGRLAARLAGTKVIIHTVHGWSFNDLQNPLRRKGFIWLERLAAKFSHKLIIVSNYDKQKGLNNRIAGNNKYILIPYGINYEEFRTSPDTKNSILRQELGIANRDLIVGMISCFKPQKVPEDFIRLAFLVHQIMPAVRFVLVGDGLLRPRINQMIDRFKLQEVVFLTGWRRDIPAILSSIDIFVLTSLWEGLPISVLEAMASSLPVAATDTGGISEVIIEQKTGFLVNPGDMKKMAEKLINLLKSEDMRRTIGQKARDSLGDNFQIENMVKNTQELYNRLYSGAAD